MSAREAVDKGFADEILQGGQKTGSAFGNVAYVNVLSTYGNIPDELMNQTSEVQEPIVDVERERNLERLRDRIKHIREGENNNE